MKYTYLLAIFLIGSFGLHSQERLDVRQAVALGLENNLSIKVSQKSLDIATNNNSPGNAGFLPSVSVSASKNFSRTNVEQLFLNDTDVRTINGAKSNTLDVSPSLTWTLFDGLGMFIARDRLTEQQLLGQDELQVTIENTVASISTAYYRIVLEKERLRVFQGAIELSKDRLEIAKTRYEVGKSSKLDYLQAQVDYNTDQSNLLNQQELIYTARVDLNRLIGVELEKNYVITPGFALDTTMVLEPLLQEALKQNPGIIAAQRNKNIAYLQLKEVRAERFPVLNFNFGYNFNDRNSDAGFLLQNTTRGINYGLSASLNLFNGNNLKRRQQNAQIQVESNELQLKDQQQQLEADLRKSYVNYANSIQLKNLEQLSFEVAQENYDIALERYKLGNSNALELREAQVNLVQAEIRQITAEYNVKLSEIELKRLGGLILK